eukprot:ANDGO_05920.mRNA.1 hypothetical protein
MKRRLAMIELVNAAGSGSDDEDTGRLLKHSESFLRRVLSWARLQYPFMKSEARLSNTVKCMCRILLDNPRGYLAQFVESGGCAVLQSITSSEALSAEAHTLVLHVLTRVYKMDPASGQGGLLFTFSSLDWLSRPFLCLRSAVCLCLKRQDREKHEEQMRALAQILEILVGLALASSLPDSIQEQVYDIIARAVCTPISSHHAAQFANALVLDTMTFPRAKTSLTRAFAENDNITALVAVSVESKDRKVTAATQELLTRVCRYSNTSAVSTPLKGKILEASDQLSQLFFAGDASGNDNGNGDGDGDVTDDDDDDDDDVAAHTAHAAQTPDSSKQKGSPGQSKVSKCILLVRTLRKTLAANAASIGARSELLPGVQNAVLAASFRFSTEDVPRTREGIEIAGFLREAVLQYPTVQEWMVATFGSAFNRVLITSGADEACRTVPFTLGSFAMSEAHRNISRDISRRQPQPKCH